MALRANIILAATEGLSNNDVAARLRTSSAAAGKWRARFVAHRIDGLYDEKRPGHHRTITDEQVADIIEITRREKLTDGGALVDPPDGGARRGLPGQRLAHLVGLRPSTPPRGDPQGLR